MGGPFKSTDHKGTSQLDSDRLRAFHYVLSAEGLVRVATCVHQSAYRVYNRARRDKCKNGKWCRRQDGCNLLWQSSKTLGCVRGRNQNQRGHIQFKRARGILVFHWQPVGRVITDWENRCVACDDSSLADTRRSAHPVI